jgi:Ni,Fe-hydrogenase III small subunit/NAD-dependent dihydropyrimidine dehydrogenase PreA subunit
VFKLFDKIRRIPPATKPLDLTPAPAGSRGLPVVDPAKCCGSQACVAACPANAIAWGKDAGWRLDLNRCNFCGVCAEVCPSHAITQTGIFALATRDKERLVGEEPDAFTVEARKLQEAVRSMLGRSLHIRHVDSGSCNGCDWEMAHMLNPVYDLQRFGVDFVASPRHADMLLVTGGVTRHLEDALRRTYAAAGEPKLVVAVGTCAIGGNMLGETYAHHGGVDKVAPVTVYVPGCPPRPEAIIHGILLAVGRLSEVEAL